MADPALDRHQAALAIVDCPLVHFAVERVAAAGFLVRVRKHAQPVEHQALNRFQQPV